VIALATERQFSIFLAYGTGLRGWAVAAQGSTEEGIAQIHQSMAALRATGTELARPRDLCLLAEAYIKTSRFEEALAALMEALAVADGNEIHFYEAETYRLKGELLLRQSDPNAAEAQKNFERAIEVARKQNAKSFELRATTSLAGLVASQGHRDEARTMLADIYGWFTEGFDTADLKDAKALLEELAA